MIALFRRLHIWVGLFCFTALAVMAAAGLQISLGPWLGGGEPAASVRHLPYRAGAGLSDGEVAAELARQLGLPLPEPLPRGTLQRDEAQNLVLRLTTHNGDYRITLLEDSASVRVEHRRNSLGEFLSLMHSRTFAGARGPLPIQLWALYVDLSIFALLFLVGSGLTLWLSSRPRLLWARALLSAGALAVAALWWVIR